MFPLEAEQPSLVCWVQAEKQAPSTCVYTTALQTWAVFLFKSFWCHISLLPQKCWSISLMKSFWIYVRFPVYVLLCKDFHVISRVYEILGGITWSANIVLVRQLFVGFGSSQENQTLQEDFPRNVLCSPMRNCRRLIRQRWLQSFPKKSPFSAVDFSFLQTLCVCVCEKSESVTSGHSHTAVPCGTWWFPLKKQLWVILICLEQGWSSHFI